MEENGQNETDKITVSLKNMGTVNKNKVTISKGNKEVVLYFSYETLIGVNGFVSVNNWSNTTEKLLNELEPDKKARVLHEEVLQKAQELLKEVIE